MTHNRLPLCRLIVATLLTVVNAAAEPAAPPEASPPLTIVTLGDSITKGVRGGVASEETFAAIIERQLKDKGVAVRVVNVGIGGERTDQALQRLDAVAEHRPRLVTVMYGTNDSYVDLDKSASRLTPEAYRTNLKAIVANLLLRGIEPILMTEPRWADDARPNGLGENPNVRLTPFMDACRAVAGECSVPLVDHFAHWTEAERRGQKLGEWTTDGCHPNPRGHSELADQILPVLLDLLSMTDGQPAEGKTTGPPLQIQLETILKHDDGKFLWYHPRVSPAPGFGTDGQPAVIMTLQQHLRASDHYSGLSVMRTNDLGKAWSPPDARPELDWVREPSGVDVAVADVTPGWHSQSRKVIAVGAQVRYSRQGQQLDDQPRAHQTAYAVYDPQSGKWSTWRRLEMPAGDTFNFARSACAQFVVEADGSVLLPFYVAKSVTAPFAATVVRCAFDGDQLQYREHGNILELNVERGLYEPSLVRHGRRYWLTIRNDLKGYVTMSGDGLTYRPIKPWQFDDGQELGSYNTQQHWLTFGRPNSEPQKPPSAGSKADGGLFLVYTRRGANNDHIIRHRAPLFLAQVDENLAHVLRGTERILVPERGATLGNFGVAAITDSESWVTVAEGVWNDDARRRGAEGAVFLARVMRTDGERTRSLPQTASKLRSGEPVRIVCFGDSVTGVYYHTGGRRAYTDMLGIALRREFPKADITMINAGISGHSTQNALDRIDRDVLSQQPTLVTVMFGLNDMTRVPLEKYRENLKAILDKCRTAGAEVLLCTPNNVISTSGRPTETLVKYCDAVRDFGREHSVPVCDCYHDLEHIRTRDPLAWRLLLSDEIHPNLDGHKRIAESLTRSIAGRSISLADVPPPVPSIPKTLSLLKGNQPIKVLAMSPVDQWIGSVLKQLAANATVEVVAWPTAEKTLAELEQDAKTRVRALKPDLVLLTIPRTAKFDSPDAFIRQTSWLMNWSLSFGKQEWDCLVIHPAVTEPGSDNSSQDTLIRQLVAAQDLTLIDRRSDDDRSAQDIVRESIQAMTRDEPARIEPR